MSAMPHETILQAQVHFIRRAGFIEDAGDGVFSHMDSDPDRIEFRIEMIQGDFDLFCNWSHHLALLTGVVKIADSDVFVDLGSGLQDGQIISISWSDYFNSWLNQEVHLADLSVRELVGYSWKYQQDTFSPGLW